jgi:hypothetical protein
MDSAIRNLAWKLNWYRLSELEGALLLGRLVRHAADAFLVVQLTRHCADEARHAQIWSETIATLGLPVIAIERSYQSLFAHYATPPANVLEVLAFTQIFERRVHKRFNDELASSDLPEPARQAFATMIADERDHLEWVHDWLKAQPGADALIDRYRAIDERIYRDLLPHESAVWALGIGHEFDAATPSVAAALS